MLPNFVVAGAAKSGTTTLDDALGQHPDVFVAPYKDCHFFAFEASPPRFTGPGDSYTNRHTITSEEAYERLFRRSHREYAIGESSVYYLSRPESFGHIRRKLGAAGRVLLVLRNPVDRAFSAYAHLVRDGRETADFNEALKREPERVAAGWEDLWRYRAMGRYHGPVRQAIEALGRDRVRIWRFEDLAAEPSRVIREAYEFLDVDPGFQPDLSRRLNASGAARSPTLQYLITGDFALKRALAPALPRSLRTALAQHIQARNVRPLPFPQEARPRLARGFAEDVRALAELTGLDLSSWLPQRDRAAEDDA